MTTELSYVLWEPDPDNPQVADAISSLRSEYFGNLALYRDSAEYRSQIRNKLNDVDRQTGIRMVEMAYIAEVASVDTVTEDWEMLIRQYIRGDISIDEFLTQTRDGKIKLDKVEKVLDSDIPAEVYKSLTLFEDPELAQNFVKFAREWLIGLNNGMEDDTYARATKSAFVTWLLGFDTLCMDRRIHRAIRPILESCMADYPCHADNTVNPSGRAKRMDSNKRIPSTVEFVHENLKWNVDEMNEYAAVAVDLIDRETEIPRDRIAQVAFNAGGGGETTIHVDLMRILAGA